MPRKKKQTAEQGTGNQGLRKDETALPGSGFQALGFDVFPPRPPHADLVMVRIDAIDAGHNARTDMNEPFLIQLQASIADVGPLQPVVVRQLAPGEAGAHGWAFRLVAGHKRLEVARRAGETHVEAKLYTHVDDVWEAKARLAENVQRDDNHIDLANTFGQAADAGMTVKEISDQSHVSDDYVRRHLALRRLCPSVAKLIASGRLPVQQAGLIARVGDPAEQIGLAESTTRLEWDAAADKWLARDGGNWKGGKYIPRTAAEQDADDRDFVLPMYELRKNIARVMRGLAACGWPMDEPYADKRRCASCPDNTLTYADQPMLFEGIKPQGSGKRGHCTNAECYGVKQAAWDTVLAGRKKAREARQKKAIAKARKAGLEICQGRNCAKVLAEGEKLVEIVGVGLCAKCAAKAQKRHGGDGGGGRGESWEAREKRIKALKKTFPSTPEQRLAVALYKHGVALGEAIGKTIAAGNIGSNGDHINIAEMVLWAQGRLSFSETIPSENRPTVDDVIGAGIPAADLAVWWNTAIEEVQADRPGIDHRGEDLRVPLPKAEIATIDDLERLAEACGLTVPDRLVAEAEKAEPVSETAEPGTRKGKKKAADLAAIDKINSGSTTSPPPSGDFFCTRDCPGCQFLCPVPGDFHDQPIASSQSPQSLMRMRNAIRTGKKHEALPAIERCADRAYLVNLKCGTAGLKGDWRRAAVARRIEDLDVRAEADAMREAAGEVQPDADEEDEDEG